MGFLSNLVRDIGKSLELDPRKQLGNIQEFGINFGQEAQRFGARIDRDADRASKEVGFNDFNDLSTALMTGGMVGRNAEGEYEMGHHLTAYDEFIGEVSGRNARRQELNDQKQILADEVATRERLEAEQRITDEKTDRASSLAGGPGIDSSSRSSRGGSTPGGGGFKLGEQRDFLGL